MDCDTSGLLTPMPTFFLALAELEETLPPADWCTWKSLSSTLQVRPLSQRGTTRPWHRPLLHSEMEPSQWPVFATSFRGKRLRQAHGGLLLSLSQRPVYTAIQASFTRRNHILNTLKKGELLSPDHTTLAALCQDWHEQQHQCQSETLTDSDQPSCWQESR